MGISGDLHVIVRETIIEREGLLKRGDIQGGGGDEQHQLSTS